MTGYQKIIREIDPTVTAEEARGIEASMRLTYGTLGHLDRKVFRNEIILFRAIERREPGYGKRIAESYGL